MEHIKFKENFYQINASQIFQLKIVMSSGYLLAMLFPSQNIDKELYFANNPID